MAGRGRAPVDNAAERKNPRNKPTHDWKTAPGTGWQHGKAPKPPDGLTVETRKAWRTWFSAWFAAYWKPEDLPGLRQVIRLYDQLERGEYQRAGELRLQMDTYGITPKGQQDRRWKPPVADEGKPDAPKGTRYSHLRAVND